MNFGFIFSQLEFAKVVDLTFDARGFRGLLFAFQVCFESECFDALSRRCFCRLEVIFTLGNFQRVVVLLFERTVSVGDVLEFDGTVGVVRKIGLRSSIVHTRLNVSMVVPNHLLVNEKVTNWTHFDDSIRFSIEVGVAYGSDTELIKRLLIQAVNDSSYVLNTPTPFVRFLSFGSSSLDFALYLFSREYLIIEDIKSDIRLNVDKLFREHGVTVPFPQRVVSFNKED